jgi:antibiotic biosynthesis monooxygenase (ABM) superfamily enzyme
MTVQKQPKKWKMAVITWICIYPLINILFFLLMPHIAHFHPLLKTFMMTLILVPLMGVILGVLQKKLYGWLRR